MVEPPGRLTACSRCGSGDLRMPGVGDGVILGTGQDFGKLACRRCGLVAVPIEFDDAEAMRAFRVARSGDKGWTRVD